MSRKMMPGSRRLLAAVLAVAMIGTNTMPAFAAEQTEMIPDGISEQITVDTEIELPESGETGTEAAAPDTTEPEAAEPEQEIPEEEKTEPENPVEAEPEQAVPEEPEPEQEVPAETVPDQLAAAEPELALASVQAETSQPVTYYVSSVNGSNENAGTSPEKAFASLMKINEITLRPGDKVMLERGSVFQNEFLHIKGSGSADDPIIIGSYGDAAQPKPLIATNGYGVWHQDYNLPSLDSSSHVLRGDVSSCILLYDVEYIEISDIAMTNEGNFAEGESFSTADRMDRTGVAGVAQNIGTVNHIVLRNLDISNVQGNVYNKHMCNGGIYMVCARPENEATGIAKYDDVLIEGCTLSNVNRWGIAVGYTSYWDKFKGKELPDNVVMEYGSTNVVVRNNYLTNLGGDAITMMYCYQPMVERNVASNYARDMNKAIYTEPVSQKNGGRNRGGMLAAGIWPWKCKTPVFQYNECYDSNPNQDGQAWDADSGDNCIYQYNYSSNNAGGTIMFCLGEAVNSVFRYNISQNDLDGVLNLSGNPNGEIYNNVFYIKENVKINRMGGGKSNLFNNIFYYAGSEPAPGSVCNWGRIQGKWSNNIYYNFSSIPDDEHAITEDPLFVNGGSAPASAQANGLVYDRSVFDGYKLQPNSPAIDAGIQVSGNGGKDFFGNKLDIMPDIGAYETGLYVADSNAEIVSTPYMVSGSGANQILYVPSQEKNPTTTEEVLSNIEIAPKAKAGIWQGETEVGHKVIEDGMVLKIYAESGIFREYTIRIKNVYDYVEEYSATQGNVWFYQYKNADGTYVNMTARDPWGGWMESFNRGMSNTWATVARENNSRDGIVTGPLYNHNGTTVESAAMAWRAPKSGSVTLSYGGGNISGGAQLRGPGEGGPSYLCVTKNGEDIITPINMTESGGSFVSLDPKTVYVEQGDYIRVENKVLGEATNPGLFVSPIITYNNLGDQEAPSVPANLRVSQMQGTKAVASWDASEDNVGVEGYNVYLDGKLAGTTKNTSYLLTGLTKGQEYKVEVSAYDLANNTSEKTSATFTAQASNLIYALPEPITLDGSEGGLPLDHEVFEASKDLNAMTITAQFAADPSLASLISFSDSSATASHFHLFVWGEALGYEVRGNWGNLNARTNCLKVGEGNAVALVLNPEDYTYKLFANGKLVHTKQLDAGSWRAVKDIANMDAVTVGWTPRDHISKYPFIGTIMDLNVYSAAMSDQAMIDYTNIGVEAPDKEKHMFSATGSMYYRIPALLTLKDGGLMAAVDARFGSAGDSPNNLDTAVVFRQAGATEWDDATIPFHFRDISDKPGNVSNNSASFIDPVIVQAADGTIFLMADAFPYGTGLARSKAGTGMIDVDGKKYLALTEKGNDITSMSSFHLYIKDDGTVWDATTNKATEYTVDGQYNLYRSGNALTVQQRDPNLQYNGKRVPMNIFYEDSELQVYRTSYLWMASSKDGGAHWSDAQILNELKNDGETFLGFGPGRGYVISKGDHKDRILIPVYSTQNGERSSVIYSDDNGQTWNRGPVTQLTKDSALNPGKTSEAQFVELPDGTIRMYARGQSGYLGYADSEDGVTYGEFREDPQLAYCGNSMVSVINYSRPIDGKPALILSSPEHREIRKNGIIRIGLINENADASGEKYTVDWKYRYEVNRDEFIYSCLTELPNGDIGLLYETHVDRGAPMNYAEYKLDDLLVEETSEIKSIVLNPADPKPGTEITVTVTLKQPATNPDELSEAVLEVLYPNAGLGRDTLAFEKIDSTNQVLTYKGTLRASETGYDYLIRMPEWCSHPRVGKKSPVVTTEKGLVNPANKDTLYGHASAGAVEVPAVTGFTADKTALTAAGGTVEFTVSGSNLANGITIRANGLTAKTTGTATEQKASITFPKNTAEKQVSYEVQYSLDGKAFAGKLNVTVAAAEAKKPAVSGFTADKTVLTAAGGTVEFTVSGSNLANGITIKANGLTAKTTGTATEQKASITFPKNTAEKQVSYEVQYSLDGKVFAGKLNVTVAAAEAKKPAVSDFTADKTALTAAGGTVEFTVSGSNLTNGIMIRTSNGLTAKTTGTATEQKAVIAFPENKSELKVNYTVQYSLDGKTFAGSMNIIVAAQISGGTEVGVISFTTGALSADGGKVEFTITGTNLPDGILLKTAGGLSAVTTGTPTAQNATIAFPKNTTETQMSYEVQYSLDGVNFTRLGTINVAPGAAPVAPVAPAKPAGPQTGDTTNLAFWMLMMAAFGSAAVAIVSYKKRNHN